MEDNERKVLAFPQPPSVIPSHLPFFVVGIGASAGGIGALIKFLESMPIDNGMAFVIVLHLSPHHESTVAEILQAKTKMPVRQVTERVHIERNHVYIIPPSKDLVMRDGCLEVVAPAARFQGRHTAIDLFLRTLADAHSERAVGVILSGAGSDGSVGIARIKEMGGMTFAQTPEDAEHDSMPRCAIRTGMIDHVLPVVEMPQKLLDLSRNAASINLPTTVNPDEGIGQVLFSATADHREQAVRDILTILHTRTGHDFSHYKRATILRRIERRLQVVGLPDTVTYRTYLDQYPQETSLLLADMLISVTNFFRDHEAFETLERDVIPAVLRDTPADESLRAWVMGCATGEEAFSVAMLMAEESARHTTVRQFQIFASDIDERAINIARRGIYPASIITDVPPIRLRQHFDQHDDYYCVKKSVRDQVLFASHNILRDPPFSRMHLITCRNVLIYLDRDIQKKVFEMMHYALHPGGFLFLGNAESADAVPDLFTPIDKKHRIYRATKHRPSKYYVPPQLPVASPRVPAPIEVRKPEIKQERPVQHLHWQLLQDAAPPSVLIDRQRHLIYATKPAGQFLQPPHGEPSNNILSLVHHDLQLELRAALFQADQSGNPVDTQYIAVHLEARVATVRILVRPARRHHEAEGMTLLMFEESSDAAQAEAATTKATENAVALHLEEDLRNTQEQLRAVIDQYESTLADLKASNEELQAVNEELRSAMEELETSKEELQSVNEELVTVNVELKSKVDETTKANDDLQNFLAATEIATVFVDRNNCIKRYSKPALKLFSLIATDIDRPLPDITHRLDYPQMQEDIVRVFETLQPQEREVRSLANEWFIARFLPYRTAADRIDGIVLTFVNISRRKAAEEKLRESERRMRLIAASTRDYAISTMDVDGNVTSWNHGAERLFGYSEDEALGQSGDMLFLLEDRKEGAFQQELQRAMHEGRAEDDRWHVRKDGSHVFCSGITSPLIDKEIHGFVKIARDLTGTKRAQDQQAARLEWEQQERLRAQESARLRDEFFAVLSHELKQPLNLIQLRAEMLSRMPGVAELPIVAVSAAAIQSSVTSQVKIIDDLMDLSRLHTGKLSLNRTTVNFTELVAQMVAMADADAQQKNLALSFEPSLPETLVYGDLVRLEQIVWNLLSNALKFTGDGGTIQVRLDQQDQMACLEVADTGRGIALEFLPFVFDMFKQADSGTARQYGGMGIGLALVQELAKSHGGYVEAASGGIGQGAQFRVRLPLARIHAKASTASANVSADVTGKRILLVDDARDTLVSMVELLTMHGAEVTAAASAQEALQKVAQDDKPYHLIISDLGMPGMDGFVLLGELRKHAATADTPAIALSGFTRERDVERAMAHGYHAHARKPVAIDYLLALAVRISN